MKTAVVLAAGEGKGAWPFSGVRQKVTVPVANVPIVRRMVLDLIGLGFVEIVVVTGHLPESVRACLADLPGVRFVEQRARKGTADAALAALADVSSPDVMVLHGDIVTTRENLALVKREFESRKAEALMLVAECPAGAPHWTTVSLSDGLVSGVIGHGNKNEPRFAGVAAAKTETLKRYLLRNPGIMTCVEIGAMPSPEGDLAHSFELMRCDGIEVHGIMAGGFLIDVDRPWHIVEANRAASCHAIANLEGTLLGEGASVHDGADIPSDAKLVLGAGAHIGKGCHIGGSVIIGARTSITNGAIVDCGLVAGDDTVIKDYCKIGRESVVGSKCLFGHGAEFYGVTFDVVYLYHYCCISGLIGLNVDIGAATVCGSWRFDNGVKTQNVNGHKELPLKHGEMTYIGDFTRTGVNVMFMPGVKIGHYCCIGAGAIIYDDVPERTLLLPKQEHVTRPWGPERYGW